jgi:hypothetical protein
LSGKTNELDSGIFIRPSGFVEVPSFSIPASTKIAVLSGSWTSDPPERSRPSELSETRFGLLYGQAVWASFVGAFVLCKVKEQITEKCLGTVLSA